MNGRLELIRATENANPPDVYPDVEVGSMKLTKTSAALPCGAR